jgi:hypothetical protein
MQIQIKKTFVERAISPVAFQQNEYVTLPREVAERLVAEGKAHPLVTFPAQPEKAPKRKARR